MKFKPINWGYHGAEKINRDSRGLIVKTSNHFQSVIRSRRQRNVVPTELVFSGGPECREYHFDTVSDEDRERLEREIGAKFKERNNA